MPANQPLLRILHPGDEPALEAFLQPRLESSLFLLGNMRQAGLVVPIGDYRIVLLQPA